MSYPGTEQAPRPRLSPERTAQEAAALLDRFQASKTKIAIQKDGALADIARIVLLDSYGIWVPESPKGRVPISVSDDGETGFLFPHASTESFLGGIIRAFATFGSKRRLNRMRQQAMTRSFSWSRSASDYGRLYRSLSDRAA